MADAKETVNNDLQKSLDDNLETMNDLLKAKKDLFGGNLEEMMKDPKCRKKVAALMKKEEYMDDNDEDDEEGDEDEAPEEDDEEEKDEEPKKESMKSKKMKKSISDIEENFDEIVDAVPVLKSFLDVLFDVSERLETLEKSIGKVNKKQDENLEIQKSFASVLSDSANLIKSMGRTALPMKGKIGQGDLFKSALDDSNVSQGEDILKSLPPATIREELLKSAQAGEISTGTLSKWEMSRYNTNVIGGREREILTARLKKGGLI